MYREEKEKLLKKINNKCRYFYYKKKAIAVANPELFPKTLRNKSVLKVKEKYFFALKKAADGTPIRIYSIYSYETGNLICISKDIEEAKRYIEKIYDKVVEHDLTEVNRIKRYINLEEWIKEREQKEERRKESFKEWITNIHSQNINVSMIDINKKEQTFLTNMEKAISMLILIATAQTSAVEKIGYRRLSDEEMNMVRMKIKDFVTKAYGIGTKIGKIILIEDFLEQTKEVSVDDVKEIELEYDKLYFSLKEKTISVEKKAMKRAIDFLKILTR